MGKRVSSVSKAVPIKLLTAVKFDWFRNLAIEDHEVN